MKRAAVAVGTILLLSMLLLSLQSCGGSDSGRVGSSNWDSMVWDVDNWG